MLRDIVIGLLMAGALDGVGAEKRLQAVFSTDTPGSFEMGAPGRAPFAAA